MGVFNNANKLVYLANASNKILIGNQNNAEVYRYTVPVGTPLWQGPYGFLQSYNDVGFSVHTGSITTNNKILLNSLISLSRPISEIKNGIRLVMAEYCLWMHITDSSSDWTERTVSDSSYKKESYVPMGLLKGEGFEIGRQAFWGVWIKYFDDTHLQIVNHYVWPNSTTQVANRSLYYLNDNGNSFGDRSVLVVERIEAY